MPRTIEQSLWVYNLYHVLSLDVWGNEEDGFEVNQTFYTYNYIAINEEATDTTILEALSLDSKPTRTTPNPDIIEGDEYALYINDGMTGKPLFQFCGVSVPDDVTLEDCEMVIG